MRGFVNFLLGLRAIMLIGSLGLNNRPVTSNHTTTRTTPLDG